MQVLRGRFRLWVLRRKGQITIAPHFISFCLTGAFNCSKSSQASGSDIDRLEDQIFVELLVERDEVLGVLLLHVEIMGGLIDPSLNEDQTVCIVGASIKIIGNTARLSAGCRLSFGRASKDILAGSGLTIDGNDELVHDV
jgi:hypothetical protein